MLDTHTLLWAASGELDQPSSAAIGHEAEAVYVSAASVWEIEIKRALGRLRAPEGVAGMVDESGFGRLPITFEHAEAAARLPLHHADPFDRMLVAQARLEGMALATADARIGRYEVDTVAVSRD